MSIPLHITTLLFDLDGTLTTQHPSKLDVLFTILDERGVPLLTSAYRDTMQFIYMYWANSPEAAEDLEMYGEFTEEFWIHYLKRKLWAAGLSEPQAADLAPEIQPILDEMYKPTMIVPDDVRPTLKTLHAKGYKMGVVTNRSGSIEDDLNELSFLAFFDFQFTAGEINSWKPDPGIFEHALYLAESSADTTAYIGDNLYTDVIGARNAGIYPILMDPRNVFPDADCQVIRSIGDLLTSV
jgi:HAD superfamily hydrolase (TIGR01549 family)